MFPSSFFNQVCLTDFLSSLDETFKSAAFLHESLVDPKTGHSGEPAAAPLSIAFNKDEALWEFFARPDQAMRHERFGVAMQGIGAQLFPPEAILGGKCPYHLSDSEGEGVEPSLFHFADYSLTSQRTTGPPFRPTRSW
jgi:hypothetical protein